MSFNPVKNFWTVYEKKKAERREETKFDLFVYLCVLWNCVSVGLPVANSSYTKRLKADLIEIVLISTIYEDFIHLELR